MTVSDLDNGPAQSAALHTSDAAKARVKARKRADGRMRLYGILAISFAALALIALLYNVFVRATNAVDEHYAVFDITVPEEALEGRFDFAPLVNEAMVAEFPSLASKRKDDQADTRVFFVSGGAIDDLRAEAAEGSLRAGTTERRLLLSDDAELYLEGQFGDARASSVSGDLSLTKKRRSVTLNSTAEDFAPAVAAIKEGLRATLVKLEEEAPRFSDAVATDEAAVADLRQRISDLGFDPDEPPVMPEEGAAESAEESQARFMRFEMFELMERMESNDSRQKRLFKQIDELRETIAAPAPEKPLKFAKDDPSFLVNVNGGTFKLTHASNTEAVAKPVMDPATHDAATAGNWTLRSLSPERARTISDAEVAMIEKLRSEGRIVKDRSWRFLQSGDSREPETAGLLAALYGSLLTLGVTFVLAFPVAVLAAIYLEEFARKNWFTDFIEVNINNLAAVPSIVFGLLGLAVLTFAVQTLQLNIVRGAPIIGGFVLALMTLPTIIIAARAAIRAVPPSIRTAALGLGASKVQTVFHHVLPLAMPGIFTGTIIGMAQALGETAPLLLIGMVAFITSAPDCLAATNCLTEQPATVLPVQVFQWANQAERGFDPRTAGAIVVLLIFLVVMNAIAILMRKRFERRW